MTPENIPKDKYNVPMSLALVVNNQRKRNLNKVIILKYLIKINKCFWCVDP